MATQQDQSSAQGAEFDSTANPELRSGLSREASWRGRLMGLEECLCELLLENQRLRMSLLSAGLDPVADVIQI